MLYLELISYVTNNLNREYYENLISLKRNSTFVP